MGTLPTTAAFEKTRLCPAMTTWPMRSRKGVRPEKETGRGEQRVSESRRRTHRVPEMGFGHEPWIRFMGEIGLAMTFEYETGVRTMKKTLTKTCPDDFEVTVSMRVWAAQNVPGVDLDFETASMKDYDFKTAHSDWNRVWRNWMRTCYRNLTRYQHKPIQKIVADAEMEKVKALRTVWGVPEFRDPNPSESISDYRRALSSASDDARAPKLRLINGNRP